MEYTIPVVRETTGEKNMKPCEEKLVKDLEKECKLLDVALKNALERVEMLEAELKMLKP